MVFWGGVYTFPPVCPSEDQEALRTCEVGGLRPWSWNTMGFIISVDVARDEMS